MRRASERDIDGTLEQALSGLLVFAGDPPTGELPAADLVVAFGEGRLLPHEAAEMVATLKRSAAARSELRALYPERFAEVFEPAEAPRGRVLRFPRAWAVGLAAAALAAAAIAVVPWVLPASAPGGGKLELRLDETLRGGVAPGTSFRLLGDLGTLSSFDARRGHRLWGALLRVDVDGRAEVVATTETPPSQCTVSENTLACRLKAGPRAGVEQYLLISAPEAPTPARLNALVDAARAARPEDAWRTLHEAAARAAEQERWSLHVLEPLEILP